MLFTISTAFDPYKPGPFEHSKFHIDRTFHFGLPENLDVWAPIAPGSYPIIYFLGGLDMAIPGSLYSHVSRKF